MISIPQGTDAQWEALAGRLRAIGLTSAWAREQELSSERMPATIASEWLRLKYLTADTPAAYALRLLARDEPVDTRQAAEGLGEEGFAFARECGLITETTDGWRSPFRLYLVDDLYLLADRPGATLDIVMGVGLTTELLARAAYPPQRVDAALDLGCGGGALALLMARAAGRVVGSDFNPRAVAMAKVNAALNGIRNVEFREGDWFSSVAGERFDLIVSQPPFLPKRPNEEHVIFMHGGARGDETAHRLAGEMKDYLTEGGVGFILAELVTAPEGVTALLYGEPVDVEVDAAIYAAHLHRKKGREWWDETHQTVAHLRQCGVEELRLAILIIGAGNGEQLVIHRDPWRTMNRSQIDALWVAGTAHDWLERRARVVAGTTMEGECALGEKVRLWTLRSGRGSLRANPQVGDGILDLIRWVTRGETLGACVGGLSATDREKALGVVDQLVRHGILEMV
jgi:SAM-dependent methyltransferase